MSSTDRRIRLSLATLAAAATLGSATARRVQASSDAPPVDRSGEKLSEPEVPVRTDVLNLGQFRVRGCRPTDKEIIDIRFGLWLVLSTNTTEADFHALQGWKHRLRDQAIIALRSAEPDDFADPELQRLQRLMMFRIKRLPIGSHVIGAYLIDFTLEEGETAEDYLRPAIIASPAPAKKRSGGGH